MDVYLVRHAIAEEEDADRWPDDSKRPLTADGIARFRDAARGLARIVSRVDAVLSSPYTRAWHTAEILQVSAGWPAPQRASALEADQPVSAAVALLQSTSDAAVALVGHEPHLSSLASLLLSGDENRVELEMKKGGAMLIEFDGDPAPGAGLLRWSLSPKILRALGD